MIQENGLTLAYLGDAIYELKVREYLISTGSHIVNDLHKEAIKYTQAKAQADTLDFLLPLLTEEEIEYYKRGRNAESKHKPKSASINVYHKSTGFEALIGYLYLSKNYSRLDEIIAKSLDFINTKKDIQ